MTDAYIPVYNEASDTWYPNNRAADLLVHLNHIWRDITTLDNLRLQEKSSAITDKLLFKYIVIEFLSLSEVMKELLEIVMKSARLVKGQPAPWRFITKHEYLETKRLAKEFWRTFQPVQKELYEIRNGIGAHRKLSSLTSSQLLWKKLDVDQYLAALNRFPPMFEHLKELNIYEWSRSFGEDKDSGAIMMSVFGTTIMPSWGRRF